MGKIYVIGIGPGNIKYATKEAIDAVNECDIIAGFATYVNLIKDDFPNKEFYSTGMRGELERCNKCVELAMAGKAVALISSGDAGVYGMASPLFEVAFEKGFTNIEVISGVSAALSGAAVLGAPINHDFCTISLSDLMTPWDVIERRLISAAQGDFVIAIYNPSSDHRPDYLKKACEILLTVLDANTICGYVKNIGRDGTNYMLCKLIELKDIRVDMFTTVFIGNSNTKAINNKMITPRGYTTKRN